MRDWTRQRGAALVEFAILAPLLILLVLGIVEFGWLFGQFNDVRHGAREGARFAAVNGGTENDIAARVCTAMEGISAGMTSVDVALTDGATGDKGDLATIGVTASIDSLTNAPIITLFLPGQLESEVSFRLEQPSDDWSTLTLMDVC